MKERKTPYLVVAEGEDEEGLVGALIRHLGLPGCDIINAQGSGNLKDRTTAAMKIPGPPVQSLAIVRDAESDPAGATTSARNILISIGFETPDSPFQVAHSEGRKCGYAILPDGSRAGAIEDLCLQCTCDDGALRCVDQLFECFEKLGIPGPQADPVRKKARVQAYLAACATERVVHRAGLGFMRGSFDLDGDCLSPFRGFLRSLLT